MEMQFKNEINKLADIAVWADNWIEELKTGLTEEELEEDTGIEEFETVKKVVLKSIERHAVYTNSLNKDIADKAAKIELLEKEIEGRKEGYWALKEKYDKLEKELEIRTKENESLITVKNRLEKEMEAHAEKIKEDLKKSKEYWRTKYLATQEERDAFMEDVKALRTANEILVEKSEEHLGEIKMAKNRFMFEIEQHNKTRKELADLKHEFEAYKEDHEGVNAPILVSLESVRKNRIPDITLPPEGKTCCDEVDYWKNQERIRTDQLRATESKVEELWKEIEKFTKGEDDHGKSGFKRYIEHLIEEEERAVPDRFKERLNKEITEIFTKEKETEVSGIPCGEDAIE